jgi:parallel beta-helix repeat protein
MNTKKGIVGITLAAIMIASIFATVTPSVTAPSALGVIQLQKTTTPDPHAQYYIGDTIDYKIVVTNPDPNYGCTLDVYYTYPNGTVELIEEDLYLDIGENKTYFRSYVVTATDGIIGYVTNTLSVTGTNDNGQSISAFVGETSTVLSGDPPVFEFDFVNACCLNIRFNGSASYDPDGSIVNHTWWFGDGTLVVMAGVPGTITHQYASCGSKTVKLSGYDNDGLYNETIKAVHVPCPPTAIARANKTRVLSGAGEVVKFDGKYSWADSGLTLNYQWTFSDGLPGTSDNECVTTRVVDGLPGEQVCATLTVNDSHCEDDDTVCVKINYGPATIYVPDDYPKIQWAVDNASAGDTIIVRDGMYTENLKVNKSLTIQSENGSANCIVQTANPGYHVFEVTADYVSISGFTITTKSEDPEIPGIRIDDADNCNISSNNCSNYGIELYNSCNDILSGNEGGVFIFGLEERDFTHDIDVSNTVNGNPIYYWKDVNGSIVPDEAGEIILFNCTNILIENRNFTNGSVGIEVAFSSSITIKNNTCSSQIFGMFIVKSNDSKMLNNTCIKNTVDGITLLSSNNIIISNNNCSNNDQSGIYIQDIDNNISNYSISNNTFCNNHDSGIRFEALSNNINILHNNCSNNSIGLHLSEMYDSSIANNTCSNSWIGITFAGSNNSIVKNNCCNNEIGIDLYQCHNNSIYPNNFINNTDDVHSYGLMMNVWNSTSPMIYSYNGSQYTNYLGNYWDGYTDVDVNGDGIWDNPYSIDSDKDYYPLKERFENYFFTYPSLVEEWNTTFGGPESEMAWAVQQTADEGYILAGDTNSFGAGGRNFWLVKADSFGRELWNKTYGGPENDEAWAVQQTADGGYILAGYTLLLGNSDVWLIKTDSSGNEQWNKTFGGFDDAWASAVQQTLDGGYMLAGCVGEGCINESASADAWLIKTDSSGNEQWNKTFGGNAKDLAYSAQQTADGGYILAGETRSYGDADCDGWLIKTDSSGNEQWNKTFGGIDVDQAWAVQQTADGGYILAGGTGWKQGIGNEDFWLVKTDSSGNEQWNKSFGGPNFDIAMAVQQITDGGYILAGPKGNGSSYDVWLFKTDSSGNEQWNRTFGAGWATSLQQTSDGGIIIAGQTSLYGAGGSDFWLIKVKGEPIAPENQRPIANAGGPYNGDINEPIQFYGSGTDPDGDEIVEYAWDFDNDWITDSELQNPTYVWTTNGTYHPTLKVKDEKAAWSELEWCEVNVYDPVPHLGPYPLSPYDKYYIRVFNIDDIGKAYVNGKLVSSVNFGQDNLVDIAGDLHLGENGINLTVKNLGEGYTYGFEIIHDDETLGACKTIWHDSCGEAGVYGCNDNEQTEEKIVYDKKITLELEEREFSDFTFVQLTDVHIGYDQKSLDHEGDMRQSVERFADALEAINNLNPKPVFILNTGDLVEWNNSNFFMAFTGISESCDIPSYFIPGNHDRRTGTLPPGDDALANYHKYIKTLGPNIDENDYLIKPDNYTFEYGGYLFIGLDSGKDYNCMGMQYEIIDWTPEGTGLSFEQMYELIHLDEKIKAMPKIIFMHHPAINEEDDKNGYPAPVPSIGPGGNDACIANNTLSFISYCKKYNVQLVLAGHTHADRIFDAEGGGNLRKRPLFIQTPSATKDTKGKWFSVPMISVPIDVVIFKHGYRVIKVKGTGAFPHMATATPLYTKKEVAIPNLANLHAYDSQGRHTGVTNFGDIELNIPKSYYTGNYEGTKSLKLPQMIMLYNTNDDYTFKITPLSTQKRLLTIASESDSINLTIKNQTSDSLTTISYYNIPFSQNTTATVSINQTITNYTIELDHNGDNVTDETKDPDSIKTNYAPNATIISPENSSTFVHGDEITFNGTGTDPEDGILTNTSLVWTSDINGLIGVGNEFNTTNLSAGTHTITLMVNDSADLIDTDSVGIVINAPDLTLNSSDILFSNPNPTESEIITINATIRNIWLINATNVTVLFFDGIPEFEISNVTINAIRAGEHETVNVTWNTLGKMGKHSISVMIDPDDSIEEMNETNNQASKSIVVNEKQIQITFFDTGKGTYPSIMGNHTGTIKPNHTIIATKFYTYPCSGTGGHTKYAEIRNATWNATATWEGYVGDWHNITFDKTVVLLPNKTYNYTIRTGSYPQIIHEQNHTTLDGSYINCTEFTDVNGKSYNNWIPAIRLWA